MKAAVVVSLLFFAGSTWAARRAPTYIYQCECSSITRGGCSDLPSTLQRIQLKYSSNNPAIVLATLVENGEGLVYRADKKLSNPRMSVLKPNVNRTKSIAPIPQLSIGTKAALGPDELPAALLLPLDRMAVLNCKKLP